MDTITIDDRFTVGPQPDREGLCRLAKMGFKTIINLRTDGEDEEILAPEEDGQQVRRLGMRYVWYQLEKGQVIFEQSVIAEHLYLKTGITHFLRQSTIGCLLLSPFIYFMIFPLLLLDFSVWLFQVICFSVWGIERVRRSEYIHLDRRHLAYLNGIEKLNCDYCGYANGLIAYVQEVAGRTEQYWCPIKPALRTKSAHRRYWNFLEYGDTVEFRIRLEQFRDQVRKS